MIVGRCHWCKECHLAVAARCTVYPNHNEKALADCLNGMDAGEWLERRAIDAVFGTIQPLDPVDVNWEVDHVAPRYIKLLDVRLDAPASVVAPLQPVPGIDVLPPSLSAGFRGEVDALVARFSHIFEMDSSPMDVAPVVLECLCPAPSLPGLFRTGYKQTPLELTFLDGEVQDWLDLEMVYSCGMPSLVCSPLFVVNPPNHRMRAVIDFSKVNGLLLPLQFPMPQSYDLLRGLEHARIFSLIDLKSGYHQVPIHLHSQWLLTFGYGGKMFRSQRLLEGISVAPAIFQSLMVGIFHLPDHCASLRASSKIWLDDFLLHSMEERSHLRLLEVFFLQCEARNVKLSLPKCVFGVTLIDWLGHVLCNGCLTPPKNYMDALLLRPRPANVRELQSYLGSVNWILLHLPDAPRTMAPMYALLTDVPAKGKSKKKPPKAELAWGEEALRSFDSVKRMLVQPQTLKVPDLSAPFGIVCDASTVGWGAVLIQHAGFGGLDDLNCWRPVQFAGGQWRSLREKSAPPRVLELNAVINALRGWSHFVRNGMPIKVWSDHKSLSQSIEPLAYDEARLRQLIGQLRVFPVDIQYIVGSANALADLLSRWQDVDLQDDGGDGEC
jgi:hypothetical protein